MKRNAGFPNPPFDLSKLGDPIDRYGQSVADAMDGGKSARAEYKNRRQVLIDMLRKLAHDVEANGKGSMELFRSSGFEPAPTETTSIAPPSETIRSLRPGPNSGQVWLKLVASDDAYSDKARWARWTEGEPQWVGDRHRTHPPGNAHNRPGVRQDISFPSALPCERR